MLILPLILYVKHQSSTILCFSSFCLLSKSDFAFLRGETSLGPSQLVRLAAAAVLARDRSKLEAWSTEEQPKGTPHYHW